MSLKKKIVIINKEKIFKKNNSFFCDNVDMKTIPEELSRNFDVSVIAVKSKIERFHNIGLEKIKLTNNIFNLLFAIFKTFKNKETSYLLISITPYSFFAYLLLFFFRKKIYVYLRSNGYEEYKAILGFLGLLIYHIMYTFVIFGSEIITCQKRLVKREKYHLLFPSELDANWLKNEKSPLIDKPKLLYVGRMRVEKGIYSLVKILDEIDTNLSLSIVGKNDGSKIDSTKVKLLGFKEDVLSLIKIYDDHNITILPSFTEAHPKVVDESLARVRPVIIFEEIDHIIQNRFGLFVSKRNAQSLLKTIQFILENYSNIQKDIKKNKLPTKQEFVFKMTNVLN